MKAGVRIPKKATKTQNARRSVRKYIKMARKGNNFSYAKRKRVFERDSFTCRYCGVMAEKVVEDVSPKNGKKLIFAFILGDWRPLELDHKKCVANGGTNNIRNIVTSCAKCNNKKGRKTYKQFLTEING